jgi:hypothetical protein
LFFDSAKNPLDAGYLNPVSDVPIDNSDKGYSFSNYWRIDEFPWGTVRGRSNNYPFSEGDIPDRTRFVRLFFGLKVTGTMWLDDNRLSLLKMENSCSLLFIDNTVSRFKVGV